MGGILFFAVKNAGAMSVFRADGGQYGCKWIGKLFLGEKNHCKRIFWKMPSDDCI
jgi:hypothetical protein